MREYPEHIQYIIDNYSNEIQQRLLGEERDISVEQAIDTFLACDISDGYKLVDWLVKTYIWGGFRWEDVEAGAESKLAEVLGMYLIYFSQIPRDQRNNIYLYRSYGELSTLLKTYHDQTQILTEETLGSREIKRRERASALKESEVLYRSNICIIAVPLTQSAAVWWGKGTKWCTSALKNNYFNQYNVDAPLIIITLLNPYSIQNLCSTLINKSLSEYQNFNLSLKNESSSLINRGSQISQGLSLRNEHSSKRAEKFQIWGNCNDVQFMDAQDCEVDQVIIEKYWEIFKPIIYALIEQNPSFIKFVPDRFVTTELCMQAVEKDGLSIVYFPERFKTLEFYRIAVEQNGFALMYLPDDIITAELCWIATEKDGDALCYVPHQFKTPELCKRTIGLDGDFLYYVPDELRTFELCKQAVSQNGSALAWVPNPFKTIDICMLAVKSYGVSLYSVPHDLLNSELCRQAVEQSGLALCYVPNKWINLELCIQAVKNDGTSLVYVPYQFKTPEVCRIAVENNGLAVKFFPENSQVIKPIEDNFRRDWDIGILEILRIGLNQRFERAKCLESFIDKDQVFSM